MAKYKAYPEYRDSGVEWLGLVPKSWTICRLKNLATIKNGQDYKSVQSDDGYPVMGSGGQFTFASKFMYDKPSVLLGRKGTIDKPLYINEPFWTVDTMYYTELNEGFDAKYLHYLALTIQFSRYSTNTALPSMTQEHLSNYKFSVPKAESERKKITEFLDLETAKIDDLIAKQQQLIELLKEKRQAVISHAVTKGLNPDVAMKDSGVEWLGEVPEHWRVSSLGYYSSLNTGATPDRSNSKYWNGEIAWIKTGEVNYNNISSSEEKITSEAVKNTSVRLSPPGTLLMAMYGQGITRGRVAILDISATYNQACVAISPNETLLNVYLRLFFMAGYHAIRDGGNETSQMNLNADIVRKFKILVPPVSEQREIVRYLDCNLPQIEILLERADSVIALLQERRTALISAAVTGKIDVRDWVAPEKQDVEEPQEATA
ncbi:restriction endonuclease subunit S [Kosakonia oryzendophytica]|uniref:restriction endonuclease subunit S n=1 Tax=Kosakonia oryzendophytica TaxID=1005665 RepID=UPI003D339B61